MTNPNLTTAIVLAAGEGTRMKSKLAKVLHPVGGRAMLDRVLDTLEAAGIGRVYVVTGFNEAQVKSHLNGRAECVTQREQLGTGHAVRMAESKLADFDGWVVVTYGDTPLWRTSTIVDSIKFAQDHELTGVVLTTVVENPTGYGRIIRDEDLNVSKIVEERDANADEKRVREINSGAYCFRAKEMFRALAQVKDENAQKQYYFTDIIGILIGEGHRIGAHRVLDPDEAMGVNSRIDLAAAEEALRRRRTHELMVAGVTIVDPNTTWIATSVQVGRDTVIHPNTIIRGSSRIGENCRIGPNSEIIDTEVGDGATVAHSVTRGAVIREGEIVGPFAALVPESTTVR